MNDLVDGFFISMEVRGRSICTMDFFDSKLLISFWSYLYFSLDSYIMELKLILDMVDTVYGRYNLDTSFLNTFLDSDVI